MGGGNSGDGAISLDGLSYKNSVQNNTIIDDRTPKKHIYGISEASGGNQNNMSNNIIIGYLTGGVNKTGANSIEVNNLLG
jgi:hypothetical protein